MSSPTRTYTDGSGVVLFSGVNLKRFPHLNPSLGLAAVDVSSNRIRACGLIPPTVTAVSVSVSSALLLLY